MRSRFSFASNSGASALEQAAGSRPEVLRRKTLATNARFLIAASLMGLPVALACLFGAIVLPFVLVTIGLGAGMASLALHGRGRFESAASVQVHGTFLAGVLLTLAQPELADFGLAVALIAPVHAALLARTPLKKRSWLLMIAAVACAAIGWVGMGAWIEPAGIELIFFGAGTFVVCAISVAHTARRLNSAFEVHEKAQIQAYRHLVEHVQDAVMRFSCEGTLLFASRSSEALFGCRRFELSWGGIGERIHVLDKPAFLTAFADANQGGIARTVEVRMRRDDPTAQAPQFIWVEAALSPVIAEAQSTRRYEVVVLLRDITRRKDQEAEMRRARREAEAASDAKSRFLATIGHELRTPLNAIVGFSEMMTGGIGGQLSPTHEEYASLIHQSGHHLLGVVTMLLDMSRIEAGKFELQTEGFAPDALIEPCLQMVDTIIRAKRVRVKTEMPKKLPMIYADERACRQILINLLSNAVKFSEDGGTVTIAFKRVGQNLTMTVSDTGIGMSAEALDRIGEPFFQVQDGLARKYEGTGLGLSIVKGLVDLHRGKLSASSVLGMGTSFSVSLPLNSPATKGEESADVTRLHTAALSPDTTEASSRAVSWPDKRRKAQ